MAAVSAEGRPAPAPARAARTAHPRSPSWQTPLLTVAIAALLCGITFYAKGASNLERSSLNATTVTEMALTLLAGAAIAACAVLAPPRLRLDGAWSVALLILFTILTALSIVWSVTPGTSWLDSARMLAYTGVFVAAVALVWTVPERWPAIIGGVTLAAVTVCAWAIATKVFPDQLAPGATYARLEEPYGYWNAIGLTAAIGSVGCLWLGARRAGHALLSALAYPALGVTLLTLVLAYSRGALAAAAIGIAAWFCLVPLRLRGAAVVIAAAVGAGAVVAWDFSQSALSSEGVSLALRTSAGHRLGALVLAMVLALSAVGIAIGFLTARRAPAAVSRRRAGAVLLALLAAAVLALAGALAHSHRGFTGTISHTVSSLTDPNAKPPANTPGRLTAVASVRARYWKEALQVFSAHVALGSGAMGYEVARLRYRTAPLVVTHAHGYVVQTLADLGLVGLAVTLALLAAWMAAAGRATHPFNRRWAPWRAWTRLREGRGRVGWVALPAGPERHYDAERIGLLSMLCIVLTFGVHSLVDWTWYVPGTACPALLCAAWLAGRGALVSPAAPQRARRVRSFADIGPVRLGVAAAAVAVALLAAWSQWQPLRSQEARQEALQLASTHPAAALAQARTAVSRDPLSLLAQVTLADVQSVAGRTAQARATLQAAVRQQPGEPHGWLELGRFDLVHGLPAAAVRELQAAIYLDPQSIAPELLSGPHREEEAVRIYNSYIEALRRGTAGG